LHFHTRTTIDTLDYSGDCLNQGSKVIIAAAGPPIRKLASELPSDLRLPEGWVNPRVCLPGVVAVESRISDFKSEILNPKSEIPLFVLVDDSEFTSRTLANFLWVTFTRSNPAADVHGFGEFTEQKHWGCAGPLVIDARIKPHHAPPLIPDLGVAKKIDALAARGGPLAKWL
jgi:4-hydroxy-3-polyprenylbenzoate decarboxylase